MLLEKRHLGFRIRHIRSGWNPSSTTYNVALRKLVFSVRKKKNINSSASSNFISRYTPKKVGTQTDHCTPMFIIALFTVMKRW